MTDDYLIDFEDRTYDDLCKAAVFLEQCEVSDTRSMNIYLLMEISEMYRLRLVINRLSLEKTDLLPQYNLLSFFGSADGAENRNKLRFLEATLNRLWKIDTEARELNNLEKFNFDKLKAKYA